MRTTRKGAAALRTALTAGALLLSGSGYAQTGYLPDALGAEYARWDEVNVYAITAHWHLRDNPDWLARHDLVPRIEGQVAYWDSAVRPTPYPTLWNVGVKGVLRWSPPAPAVRPFAEAGLGVHLLSHVHIYDRNLGSAFQFGSRAAAGIAFGPGHGYEIGVFVEHISNARLAEANEGLTYVGVLLRAAIP